MKKFLLLFIPALVFAQEVEITAEPHHHEVLSNNYIRAFSVEVPPHSETLMHWHRHDYIFVTLGESQVVNAVKGKAPVQLTLHDGDTVLLRPPFAHIARNTSDKPFRNVTIELLQDEKSHHAPAHWDASHPEDDRGLQILDHGTQEILWYKDGVRASQIDLEPGGTLPATQPAHPRLLVAVNDCDLMPTRAAVHSHDQMQSHDHMHHTPASTKPTGPALHLKSGEAQWLPATDTHTLENSTHTAAKFVELEFQ